MQSCKHEMSSVLVISARSDKNLILCLHETLDHFLRGISGESCLLLGLPQVLGHFIDHRLAVLTESLVDGPGAASMVYVLVCAL